MTSTLGAWYPPTALIRAIYDPSCGTGGFLFANPPFALMTSSPKTIKVVINRCYGGYGLSPAAQALLGVSSEFAFSDDRSSPALVACVETLGSIANGQFAELKVIEIPDNIEYTVESYDGIEWIAEAHRTWP